MSAAPHSSPIVDADAAAALLTDLAASDVERAAVLHLDPKWRLLGRQSFRGGPVSIAPPFRTIFAEALRLDAAALIIAHSHPSGCTAPSRADMDYTRALVRVATALDIVVTDHLIITRDGIGSLRALGLL